MPRFHKEIADKALLKRDCYDIPLEFTLEGLDPPKL